MIAQHVMDRAAALRESFEAARPFKHLCIDDFLEPGHAEALLSDFPRFDREKARNEFGEYGRKAVQPRLAEISAFYERTYRYLLSREFLDAMQAITGIDDLISDPTMFGGGTHDNLDGQELDPHIDFNYTEIGDAHRRVNLLVYLNKGWEPGWGGQIELHSNPRDPDRNAIEAFNVSFNRAVLFETNEISWHGFPRIRLPPSQAENSRKCLSVYLYTKTRPAHEIVGRHSTFYVQRPLGPQFVPGHVLDAADVLEAQRAVRSRDTWIASYQAMEERLSREMDARLRRIADLQAQVDALRRGGGVPVAGHALLRQVPEGTYYDDGWATGTLTLALHALRPLTRVELSLVVTEQMPDLPRTLTMEAVAGQAAPHRAQFTLAGQGASTLMLPVAVEAGSMVTLSVTCSATFRPAALGLGPDDRDLAYMLEWITLE